MFGSYRLATPAEAQEWTDFAAGIGPLPEVTGDFDEELDEAEAAE
jgi:hypothetical protein